ncbi:hypothetical protein Sp245p_02220 [Azospirillum baldaniorum]|uniref:UPF0235 protein AZOBR_10135 n=1 Tax=Azospirillum baldaniorum TaxID=1064539 RepID=A0A9P1JMT2_9PROT|nr:DUF167 family protein [Azospirillum baldaniorum]AWJ88679.1 hypothetical protein Sp245p_02220 [Azospirillum baldaniorum]NUB06613.1 DUF167 domain-containing protein [Azospirillum baldaniorum]TWA79784.1 hypothetical protein FBZ85_104123 [Azospirillum brasilense]CCC96348.1 conserved protein of unknown function [Azospirillum baldaniorum]
MTGPLEAVPFEAVADGVRLALRVTPKASRNAIAGLAATASGGTALKVTVTAVPENGKANEAVVKLLAKAWKLPKTSLTVVAGATDRNKIVHVAGDPADLMRRLTALVETAKPDTGKSDG